VPEVVPPVAVPVPEVVPPTPVPVPEAEPPEPPLVWAEVGTVKGRVAKPRANAPVQAILDTSKGFIVRLLLIFINALEFLTFKNGFFA
jgi:hypothetical protein